MAKTSDSIRVSRRKFMKASAATGAALAGGSVFAPAAHAAKTYKIGYVSPQTGPLAAFAEADNFVISNFLNTVKGGVKVGSATLPVAYKGILPDLFREGQGVVAEGALDQSGVFRADTVLAKHDETYMPKDVADALKKQGHWKDDYDKKLVQNIKGASCAQGG